jgi:TP901 family phage tail tape measure protein
MPGTAEYWYVLKLDGDQALKEAKAFAQAVKQEMKEIRTTANIVLKATINTSAVTKQAKTSAQKVAAEYKKALASAQRDFTATASRSGAQQFTQNYRAMWEEGSVKPSAKAIASIRDAESAIGRLGQTARRMGVTTDDLVNMSGLDRAIGAVQAVQRKMWGLRGLGYQLESYGRSMTMAAAAMGAAVVVTSSKYLKFADPLGRAARNLDLNAELTEVLDHRLTELAGTISMMSPQEQAEGLYLWAAATGAVINSEEELNETLAQADQVQRLAKLGNVSYGVAVEATTDILSQYQLNISETERVVGTLIKVAAVSKAEVGDLAQAFSFAGARADQANTSFEETAAVFQLLSAFGLRGTRAGRGVGMLMENLIAPSERARKEIDALFKTAFGRTDMLETAEGQFVGMAEAINILAEATEHLTEMETQEFVAKLTSQNASRALVPLLKLEAQTRLQGISAIEATANILEGNIGAQELAFVRLMEAQTGFEMSTESATDTAERYWTQLSESVAGQAEFIKASFAAAVTDIGREMTTVLLPVMREAAELASKLAGYVSEHPGAAKLAIGAVATVGVIGLLTTAVGKGIRLVADIKTVAMATSLYNAATMNIEAAAVQMAASQNQIRAAATNAARQPIPGAGAQFLPVARGGGAGAGLGGLAAIAVPAAVLVGAGLLVKHLADLNKEHLAEATVVAQTSDSYEEYIQRLKDAGDEKYALAEATYDLVKARQEEQDGLNTDELAEYERALREAVLGAKMELGVHLDALGGALATELPIDEFERDIAQLMAIIVRDLSDMEISTLKQRDMVYALAEQYGIYGERATIVANEAEKIAFWIAAIRAASGDMELLTPEAEAALKNAGFEIEELEKKTRKAAAAAAAAKRTWEETVTILDRMDSALVDVRDGLLGMIAALRLVPGAAGAIGTIERQLAGIDSQLSTLRFEAISSGIEEGAGRGLASLEELAEGAKDAAESGFSLFEGLADYMPDEEILSKYQTYLEEMDRTYKEAALMSERAGQLHVLRWQSTWDDWATGHKDAQDQVTKDAEDAAKDRQKFLDDAQKGFEGLIQDVLKPTSVTGLDMLDTELGDYADKWDENARRMRAAMADPGGEWGFMIPEDVKAKGDTAAQAYGQRWLDSFYAGLNPDAIDWPAFVQSFRDNLARAAAQENLLERAIQELAAEGITATSAEVLSALGLQSPIQQMFLGGLSTKQASDSLSGTMGSVVTGISIEEGAFDTAAGTIKGAFDTSLTGKLGEMSLPQTLNALWVKQMTDTPDPIIAVGRLAGALFWQGFEKSVDGTSLIDHIVGVVMESIAEAIGAT